MTGRTWKSGIVIAACIFGAVFVFSLLYDGFLADRDILPFGLGGMDRAAAERAYRSLPATSPPAQREAAALRRVRIDPAGAESWEAVSYSRFLRQGGLSPYALVALDHSYALSFFDRPTAVWRVGYALENWSRLPAALRADVLAEARVVAHDYDLEPALRTRVRTVRSPEGRSAGAMVLAGPWSADDHPLD